MRKGPGKKASAGVRHHVSFLQVKEPDTRAGGTDATCPRRMRVGIKISIRSSGRTTLTKNRRGGTKYRDTKEREGFQNQGHNFGMSCRGVPAGGALQGDRELKARLRKQNEKQKVLVPQTQNFTRGRVTRSQGLTWKEKVKTSKAGPGPHGPRGKPGATDPPKLRPE